MHEGSQARIALVTGAGGGIGRAIALELSRQGYAVVAVGRRKEPLDTLVAELVGPGLAAPFDVTAAGGLLSTLPEEWREIDVLINNAGSDVGGRKPFHAGDMSNWRGTIETNVIGLMEVTRDILAGMAARGRGHVVNIGSSVARRSYAGCVAYATSKAAVHMLTDCLRAEHVGTGVRVTEIAPGLVRTDFDATRKLGDAEGAQRFYDSFDTVLSPDDVARAVAFALQQPPNVVIAEMTILPTSDW